MKESTGYSVDDLMPFHYVSMMRAISYNDAMSYRRILPTADRAFLPLVARELGLP